MALTLDSLAEMFRATPDVAREAMRLGSKAIQVVVRGGVMEHFDQSVSPDGTPWKPLAHQRPNGGDKPLRDKGLLMASVSALVTEDEIEIRANAPGARLHNFGGTVVPVNAKALAIPISKEAQNYTSPRGGTNPFPRPLFLTKGGALCETVQRGKKRVKAVVVAHYILRAFVEVPARAYAGISESTMGKVLRIVGDKYVAIVLRQRGGT